MKPKIIAMYLPQFHRIPENDEFWGEGFTDWVTVKKAKPLFEGHQQPRVPLNNNYYDLSQKESVAWQAKIAKEYGIYGFGIYHYWFNTEKNILTKPAEIIRDNEDIDINYFFAWDNISWKRSWSNVKEKGNAWAPAMEGVEKNIKGPDILIPFLLGNKHDWQIHFVYLLPFFKDKRYIKIGNKPIFCIFHYEKDMEQMFIYWDELARENGFDGIFWIFRYLEVSHIPLDKVVFKYEPLYSGWTSHSLCDRVVNKIKRTFNSVNDVDKYNYDRIWDAILKNAENMADRNYVHGAFVSYDDTPRRGMRGKIVEGATPQKFKKYLSKLIEILKVQNKEYLFLTAWNEWGEGACLEPDTDNQYKYLEAVKAALE